MLGAHTHTDGPDLETVENGAPWVATVAGGSLPRVVAAPLQLGNGATLEGVGWIAARVGPAPLVYAGDAAAINATSSRAKQCLAGSLDPAKVAGKIVACDRGPTSRFAKAEELAQLGAIGMVLQNSATSGQDLVIAIYAVPTIHISKVGRAQLLDYTSNGTSPITATLGTSTVKYDVVAPEMYGFSGRGPVRAANGAVMAPDVCAPGTTIISNDKGRGALLVDF